MTKHAPPTTPAPSSAPLKWPDSYSPGQRAEFLRWARQPGHHLLPRDDPAYPPLLQAIADPPPLLFVRGNVDILARPQFAIVGSRHPTPDGRRNARMFAGGMSAKGYVITSGLALGIDAEAHRGTLESGGITIAVLGSGLDNIYPAQHAKLAAQIAEQGALVSEFPPAGESYRSNFPQRNRIVSGLAHGVLVVEAAQQSGTLITARCAAEQGREVFALPGSIHNPYARGCHRLIRQGVKLADCLDDILEELPPLTQWERQLALPGTGTRGPLTLDQKKLLEHIAYDAVSFDTLLLRTNIALPELYVKLMQLELAGHIINRPDGYVLSPR